jgi:tetratricopeptide (TPR) repeat protein
MAYLNRGVVHGLLGNWRPALDDFNKAIELNPQFEAAYVNRGFACFNLGDYSGAVREADRAIGLNPKLAIAYYNRGAAYAKLGNAEQALADMKTSAELGHQGAQDFVEKKRIAETKRQMETAAKQPQKPAGQPDLPVSRDGAASPSLSNAELPIAPILEPSIRTDAPPEVQPRYKNIRGVVLYDGRTVEGQIVSMNTETVNIRTPDGKILSFSFMKEVQNFLKDQGQKP